MVQAFRRSQSPFESARFKLRGLARDGRYKLADIDSGVAREFSGRELMEQGVPVEIKTSPGAVILTYERASL